MKKIALLLVVVLGAGYFQNVTAQRKQSDRDAEGSHATGPFNRYPGSVIEYYQERYQKYYVVREKPYFSKAVNDWDFPVTEVRGDVLRILYSVPMQNTPEDCYEYYLRSLKASGFRIIFKGWERRNSVRPSSGYRSGISSDSGYNPLRPSP